MSFTTGATSTNFLQNWWGYTNYFLNQKPWLKYALIVGSTMMGAYVAWPFGLTFKAVSLFGVTSLMSHFLSYAFAGSLNLSWQLLKTFSLLRGYLENPALEEEANLEGLFNQLFSDPQQVNFAIASQLEQSIDSKFQSWASNYQGNKVPNNYEAELEAFLQEVVTIEADAFMPHVNYVFDILSLHYRNQGHQEDSCIFDQMNHLHAQIQETFKVKFLESIYQDLKHKLMTPLYEQLFFKNALQAMIKKQLGGIDPLKVLGIQEVNPTVKHVGKQFKATLRANKGRLVHAISESPVANGDQIRVAKDIAIAQIQHNLKP